MKASARLRPRGFWRGLATGVGLAIAAVVAVTLAFPPVRFFAPAVDPVTQLAPPPPAAPVAGGDFARPRAAALPGAAGGVASLARVGDERPPNSTGLVPAAGPGREALRPPTAPAAPQGSGAAPGRGWAKSPAVPGPLAPAAGAPLVTVARDAAPDARAILAPAPEPRVGPGTPSLVPPTE